MAEAGFSTNQTIKQEQRQQLSQNMLQSLAFLELPLAALENRLAEEFTLNPFLEESVPECKKEDFSEYSDSGKNSDDFENDYDAELSYSEQWHDELPLPEYKEKFSGEELDYLGNSPAPPPSLRVQLLAELNVVNIPENLLPIALEIISALDDDGFLTINPADLAMSCDAEMHEVEEALQIVQNIAPAGVAARNVGESLKLQLAGKNLLTPEFEKLLDNGMELLEKNKMPQLADMLNISMDELDTMLKILKTLNPAPGRCEKSGSVAVLSDIDILLNENQEYVAVPRRENFTGITLSPVYQKLLQDESLSSADRKFLQEKLNSAKELIQALAMRQSTLKQLGDLLVRYQKDFFDSGIKALKPMTMKKAGEILNLSESTISRAVSEKFISTPHGFYPLKFFFSGGVESDSGEEIASSAVIAKIKELIANENPAKPLSDEALAEKLKEQGINIARRTVAKYRDKIKIPSAAMRKKHF